MSKQNFAEKTSYSHFSRTIFQDTLNNCIFLFFNFYSFYNRLVKALKAKRIGLKSTLGLNYFDR